MWNDVLRLIREEDSFLITSHLFPDGDALGSAVALLRVLRGMGKNAGIVNPGPVPKSLAFLCRPGEVGPHGPGDPLPCGHRVLFVLDTSSPDRLGSLEGLLGRGEATSVCIDHHADNVVAADVRVVDGGACSTGELVYRLLRALGAECTLDIALPLYVALHTDTVSFNFLGTDSETLAIASDLLSKGIDPSDVYQKVYKNDTWGQIRLAGEALSRIRADCGGRVAWMLVSDELLEKHGVPAGELDSLARYPLTVEGVRVVILFCRLAAGRTRVSLRTFGDIDVGEIARRFGGGGHRTSAGVTMPSAPDEAVPIILRAVREAFRAGEGRNNGDARGRPL